jgi:hypothetical protein
VLDKLAKDENVPNEVTEAAISDFLGGMKGNRRNATTSQADR